MIDGKKIFGAFTIAIALFFFWPSVIGNWQEVSALRETVAERQELLTARQQILSGVQSTYQDYTAKLSAQDGQKFAALVPVRKDQAEIISATQDMATNTGVTVNELRISEEATATGASYKTLSLDLDMGGTYPALRAFLTDLEQYVRLLNIDSIQVSEDTRAAGRLTFAIKAKAYFLK